MPISEEEIYSIMFTSLKHPVRRKILRMLANKPMPFMVMVEQLGVSTSHLTYHLESLGELVSKQDDGTYKLSTFGVATVSAMNGVEEAPQIEQKRRWKLELKWKAAFGALLIAVILLAGMATTQYTNINSLSESKSALSLQNKQLLSTGTGPNKVYNFLDYMTATDVRNYTVTLDSDVINYRSDFNVAEETIKYTLATVVTPQTSMDVNLRFRNNHFSRYDLILGESTPILISNVPSDLLQNVNLTLRNYKTYSGDAYVTPMINLLSTVTNTSTHTYIDGNMALQITNSAGTVTFYWMYYQEGIYFQSKGLMMTFQNNLLTVMTDGYFLFTIGSTSLAISQDQAISIAKNYVKTMSYPIQGKSYSGFEVVQGAPLSTQLVPHTRGNSVALIPYYFVELKLTAIYPSGYNEVGIGIYADTGQVSDANMLISSSET